MVAAAFSPDARMVACAFEVPMGPDLVPGYLPPDEFGLDPLPEEIDELLGHYDDATEWQQSETPDGAIIPVAIADVETGEWVASFYASEVRSPARDVWWSADGRSIMTASSDGIATWQTRTGQLLNLDSAQSATRMGFSPNEDERVTLGRYEWQRYEGHSTLREGAVVDAESWEPEDEYFTAVSCSAGQTAIGTALGTINVIRRDRSVDQQLEGHTKRITSLSFSADGRLLASKSLDGTIRLWDCSTWETISVLREAARGQADNAAVAFAPNGLALSTLGPAGKVGRIWQLDLPTIMARRDIAPTVHYSNAKAVLLGDSGVGKTGLGLVLAGEEFRPTESSHRRNVWLLDTQEFEGQQPERRETYLWDLAGQPGYRLLHQLHLSDAAVAVILFDAKSDSDPFAGVRHWVKALRQAERQGKQRPRKLLVAARMDRGGPQVSDQRLREAKLEFGFDRYLETSAKDGRGIDDLQEAIASLIDWDVMPKVSSTGLFDSIKAFLVAERDRDRLLVSAGDLRETYLSSLDDPSQDLTAEFETCIGRVAARGLIRRLSFGGLVLLRPEVLDAYAASLTMAAREQPDGMGSINEEAARL